MLRYCPNRPLPPYSYVPGHFPHPVSDPAGHSYAHSAPTTGPPPPRAASEPISLASDWAQAADYLFGIDLFNQGYYWEAHETWESLWIQFARTGRDADFTKGLIKLAAAGVKAREGRPLGVQRHARRARELFLLVADQLRQNDRPAFLGGLDLPSLTEAAGSIAANAAGIAGQPPESLSAMLPLRLSPANPPDQLVSHHPGY